MTQPCSFLGYFEGLQDPRMDRTQKHPMESLVFISVAAITCGAETWDEIEEFGVAKQEWLSGVVPLPNGIPSHDTFNRFYAALMPGEFEECFAQWTASIAVRTKGEVLNIDGKTLRGSKGLNSSAAHVVSAWSGSNHISLGQLRVEDKTNESTMIPELLSMLFIEGCVVTIDAAGCYSPIAKAIVEKQADYVICAKANQPDLLTGIEESFALKPVLDTWQDIEGDHGRITTRTCTVIADLDLIPQREKWPGLRAIARVDSEVYHKATAKKSSMTRYFITTLMPEAKLIGSVARAHWSIENGLHWQLDVSYREDASRKRKDNAPVNFSTLTKMTLTMLKRDLSTKVGIKSKRLKAGWDNQYLLKVLGL
jgi:predicted transposase YbfD/YdcC